MDDAPELVHGTCVALGRAAALLRGPSGSGKSDLALRFLYLARRGPAALEAPILVADDQVHLTCKGGRLIVRAPESIRGRIEVRGVGIVDVKSLEEAELVLVVDLVPTGEIERLPDLEDEIAKQVAVALNRPLGSSATQVRPRYSKDPMAYAEFMRAYRLSSPSDQSTLDEAAQHLSNAVTRDPAFALAHATLSVVCATKHFELSPASTWLEKAEFHCRRALELDPNLPEGHVASAFLLWGPSRNFQHLEAIAELKRALTLQNNQPHAYNRLGTILAHVGLLEHAREMYERGRAFHPTKAASHSIVQVYVWNREYEAAREQIAAWRAESPENKYAVYFAPQPAMMTGHLKEASVLMEQAVELLPEEPMIASLQGVYYALAGKDEKAIECLNKACTIPKTFGHAHHSYYQIACILALLERPEAAFEWLERSVATGFACWPYFLKDPWIENLRELPEFDVLVSSLQAKYPDHLGLL